MTTIIYDRTSGRILRSVSCPPALADLQVMSAGEAQLQANDATEAAHFVRDGTITERPECPAVIRDFSIENLPTDAEVRVNGELVDVGAVLDLAHRAAGRYTVHISAFPCRDLLHTFEVPKSLSELREDKKVAAKALREAALNGGCRVAPYGPFDTDEVSRGYINGAVSAASMALQSGQAFDDEWTLADNSVVTLTASDVIAVGLGVAAHVSACHARYRELKSQIAVAPDEEALGALDVTTGWSSA